MSAPYLVKPFTPEEDRILAVRKYAGVREKVIAHELHRPARAINCRWQRLRKKLERRHPDVLEQHRQEELALLEALIAESTSHEVHGDEI